MKRDVIAIGASAGGVEALHDLVRAFPPDFPAALLIVVHVPPNSKSALPQMLSRWSPLPAIHPTSNDRVEPGKIYVAPPDFQLLLHGDRLLLTRGARENGHRPSIDPLFRSVARWRGSRSVAVLLSGSLDDGTAGMVSIQAAGGTCIAQDPGEALFAGMPQSAIDAKVVDHVLRAGAIAALLRTLITEELPASTTFVASRDAEPAEILPEDEPVELAPEIDMAKTETQGPASSFTCPDCHGALWEHRDGELLRYRCRVGHAFSSDSLLAAQLDSVEEAMWMAYRALEESASIAKRLAEKAQTQGFAHSALRYLEKNRDALARAAIIRRALAAHVVPDQGESK